MDDVIQSFFEQLAKRGYVPLLHTTTGTCRFDMKGRGSWGVAVKEGLIAVSRDMPQADCVISGDPEMFVRMIEGKQNPTRAFMQGILQFSGDIGMGQMFQRLFRIHAETAIS